MAGTVRRLVVSVLAWIVGAAAAVAVGVLALTSIGDGLTARTERPLGPEAVAREASAAATGTPAQPSTTDGATPTPTTPAPTTPAPTDQGADKLVWSPGGTTVARCAGAQAYLVSWSPEQGYRAHDVTRGPAEVVSVRFDADDPKGDDTRVLLTVRCVDGQPQPTVTRRGDDAGDH
jgi:hypothetical protein